MPHFATYRATIVRYPPLKQARKSFAILLPQASRDMKSIAAGPLSPKIDAESLKSILVVADFSHFNKILALGLLFFNAVALVKMSHLIAVCGGSR